MVISIGAAAFWIAVAAVLISGGYFQFRRERLRQETGHVAQGDERRSSEQTRKTLASELDEEMLAAAHTIGREMTFEQAVAFALQN